MRRWAWMVAAAACAPSPGPDPQDAETLTLPYEALPPATRGIQFAAVLEARGSSPRVLDWAVRAGELPAGLALEPLSSHRARLFGAPSEEGAFAFTVVVTDGSRSAAQRFNLTVLPPDPELTIEGTLPPARLDAFYRTTFVARGPSSSAHSWSLGGELPPGLELVPTETGDSAELRGVPQTGGTFTVEIFVKARTQRARYRGELYVGYPPLRITTTEIPAGAVGIPYLAVLRAQGGSGESARWSLVRSPPSGVFLDVSTDTYQAELFGTPQVTGVTEFDVKLHDDVADAQVTATLQLTVNEGIPLLKLLNGALPPAFRDTAYRVELAASGGQPPYRFFTSGELPPGLSLEGPILRGRPQQQGTYAVEVGVRDRDENIASRVFTVDVGAPEIGLMTETLPVARVGVEYVVELQTENAPDFGLSWYLTGDPIPGIQLRPNAAPHGQLFGVPKEVGTYSIVISVQSLNGRGDYRPYTLEVRP